VNKKGLLAALVLTLLYLAAYYYLDFKNPILISQDCEKTDAGFCFKPKEFLRLRSPSDIRFTFNRDIDGLRIVWKEPSQTALPNRISNRQWALIVDEEVHIARIDLVPEQPELRTLGMRISRIPLFRFSFLAIQFLTVFFLAYFCWEVVLWISGLFLGKNDPSGEFQTRLTRASVMAVSPFFVYVFFNLFLYRRLLREWQVPLAKGLLLNLFLAVFLAGTFWALTKVRVKKIALPVLFSILIILLTPKFKLEICGDAVEWLRVISSVPGQFGNYSATTVSFAESLSVLLGKGVLGVLRSIFSSFEPAAVYTLMGKAQGIFYAFVLYVFVFRQTSLSERQKTLYYVLGAALPAGLFFLGFPEFAYFALPCLLLSLILADRYLRQEGGDHWLLVASLVLTIGGLFHGSAWFSLPVLFVLPVLKWKKFPRPRPLRFFGKSALLLTGGFLLPLLILAAVSELAGTTLVFYTALGGAGANKFVKPFPALLRYWNDKNFSEKAYIFLRGWIFLIGFPLPLLVMGFRRAKRGSPALSDKLLLLAALTQLAIVFFWGFDLNIKDFDLYIIPQTLFCLFLLKKTVGEGFSDERLSRAIALIFLLTLASPIGIFLAMTSR